MRTRTTRREFEAVAASTAIAGFGLGFGFAFPLRAAAAPATSAAASRIAEAISDVRAKRWDPRCRRMLMSLPYGGRGSER
jgi:hypothetical protein